MISSRRMCPSMFARHGGRRAGRRAQPDVRRVQLPHAVPGMNPTCVTVTDGYPRGLCTRTPASTTPTAATGHLLARGLQRRSCLPTCRTVADCRDGYQCQGITGRSERA